MPSFLIKLMISFTVLARHSGPVCSQKPIVIHINFIVSIKIADFLENLITANDALMRESVLEIYSKIESLCFVFSPTGSNRQKEY